jgi:hypothetical protein
LKSDQTNSKSNEILAIVHTRHGESLPKRSPQKDQDFTMNFMDLLKNTWEEGFWGNPKFDKLVANLERGSP